MRYFLAVAFPPAAVLLCGKPFQAILNFFFTLLFYFPGMIHALSIVREANDNKRTNKVVNAIKSRRN